MTLVSPTVKSPTSVLSLDWDLCRLSLLVSGRVLLPAAPVSRCVVVVTALALFLVGAGDLLGLQRRRLKRRLAWAIRRTLRWRRRLASDNGLVGKSQRIIKIFFIS